ncbi:hypothetical protein OC861_006594 [Tilletia horrida]|nr:hypothetical protein OC861_006594 [Tilletia horrida]
MQATEDELRSSEAQCYVNEAPLLQRAPTPASSTVHYTANLLGSSSQDRRRPRSPESGAALEHTSSAETLAGLPHSASPSNPGADVSGHPSPKRVRRQSPAPSHQQARCLQAYPGLPILPDRVRWSDCEYFLPPADACHHLFTCFYTNLDAYFATVHPLRVEELWTELQENRTISRSSALLLFSIAAVSMSFLPKSSPAASAMANVPQSPRQLYRLVVQIIQKDVLESAHESIFDEIDFERLQALTTCVFFASMSDLFLEAWFLVSYTIRFGKLLSLFDERHWPLVPELTRELRRRLAWDLICVDRWHAVFNYNHADLDRELEYIQKPTLLRFSRYDYQTGALLTTNDGLRGAKFGFCPPGITLPYLSLKARNDMSNLILRTCLFNRDVANMTNLVRQQKALAIESAFDDFIAQLDPELDYVSASAAAHPLQPRPTLPLQRAATALHIWCSVWSLRCILTRVFLRDLTAIPELRFASLKYARSIIESMHATYTLSTSPWISFPSTWLTGQMFVAATTFASLFLTDSSPSAADTASEFGNENLDWFASNIFDVVATLDMLALDKKNSAANTSREILIKSCNATEALRDRFKKYTAAKMKVNSEAEEGVRNDPAFSSSSISHMPLALQKGRPSGSQAGGQRPPSASSGQGHGSTGNSPYSSSPSSSAQTLATLQFAPPSKSSTTSTAPTTNYDPSQAGSSSNPDIGTFGTFSNHNAAPGAQGNGGVDDFMNFIFNMSEADWRGFL